MRSTNLSAKSSTPGNTPFPLHKLNSDMTRLWLISKAARRQMAEGIVKGYGEGVGIISSNMYLIAMVHSNGGVEEVPPPHRRFKIHQISNQPEIEVCACARFFDPETKGPWSERGERRHHPLCQFLASSGEAYDKAAARR